MERGLTPAEARAVRELAAWERRAHGGQRRFAQLLLILGGLVIVVSAYLTLRHLSDRTALTLTMPGFVTGLALIGVALQLGRRIRERHVLASVIRKLRGDAQG
jgi:hypothetical protein